VVIENPTDKAKLMLKINLKTNFKNQHQEETHKLLISYTLKIAKKALKE
jgi:hypothetical protein